MTSLTPIVRPVASADAGAGVFLQREPHEAGAIRRHPAGDGAIDELELLPIQAQGHDLRRELPVRWRSCHDDLPVTRTLSCKQEWMDVNGVAAGLSTKSNKLGYIAAKPIALVLRTINAFALGARKVNPKAEVHVVFTGDWTLPVREAESVNALAGAGCDVIACHIDSPKVVIENAEARGIKTCGHNTDQARLAPKGFITGAELKYITIYKSYSEKIVNGEKLPNLYEGGFDRDMVQNTAFGAGATDAARTAAMAATAEIKG